MHTTALYLTLEAGVSLIRSPIIADEEKDRIMQRKAPPRLMATKYLVLLVALIILRHFFKKLCTKIQFHIPSQLAVNTFLSQNSWTVSYIFSAPRKVVLWSYRRVAILSEKTKRTHEPTAENVG